MCFLGLSIHRIRGCHGAVWAGLRWGQWWRAQRAQRVQEALGDSWSCEQLPRSWSVVWMNSFRSSTLRRLCPRWSRSHRELVRRMTTFSCCWGDRRNGGRESFEQSVGCCNSSFKKRRPVKRLSWKTWWHFSKTRMASPSPSETWKKMSKGQSDVKEMSKGSIMFRIFNVFLKADRGGLEFEGGAVVKQWIQHAIRGMQIQDLVDQYEELNKILWFDYCCHFLALPSIEIIES